MAHHLSVVQPEVFTVGHLVALVPDEQTLQGRVKINIKTSKLPFTGA